MSNQSEQQALAEIYADVPVTQPTDLELMEMFEDFIKTQPKEEIPNLPRGFDQ